MVLVVLFKCPVKERKQCRVIFWTQFDPVNLGQVAGFCRRDGGFRLDNEVLRIVPSGVAEENRVT